MRTWWFVGDGSEVCFASPRRADAVKEAQRLNSQAKKQGTGLVYNVYSLPEDWLEDYPCERAAIEEVLANQEATEVDLGTLGDWRLKLTMASPASSYGQPVLRIQIEDGVTDYGPEDLVPMDGSGNLLAARNLAMQLVSENIDAGPGKLTPLQEKLIDAFCGF